MKNWQKNVENWTKLCFHMAMTCSIPSMVETKSAAKNRLFRALDEFFKLPRFIVVRNACTLYVKTLRDHVLLVLLFDYRPGSNLHYFISEWYSIKKNFCASSI